MISGTVVAIEDEVGRLMDRQGCFEYVGCFRSGRASGNLAILHGMFFLTGRFVFEKIGFELQNSVLTPKCRFG